MALPLLPLALSILLLSASSAQALRFVIDRKECFAHPVEYDGDLVHVSYVVVKSDSTWGFEQAGVDLVVEGPGGIQAYDVRNKPEEKSQFVAHSKGLYKFCFHNLSPVHETIAFDVYVGHFPPPDDHAKDDHIDPLMGQIARLEEALYSVSFEQHWLQAQTERQSVCKCIVAWLLNSFLFSVSRPRGVTDWLVFGLGSGFMVLAVNNAMSKRVVYKAVVESAALISASLLQVYLLRRLFEKRFASSRV
ncbi:transmembrane emp24 domain-containing protein p24beta2 isoform X1 [Selaginella moellendorffii]|uniref:transmembrane emp24 domain-containing protein p24beta2 isoform X1 n=1 Tax=Selaginella moellendorffii TaxID=88036 RepID=UPI000D1C7E2C|nr:transmembrane emp24 domain-containing protein p24beta2 isoform X1 [Selaginella moellendorffii]|eukprot:XP_024543697.1 transmembrane emp24 domain-containing protein p24beta2 isoform X1 [Selaginella moellendorffii]